MDIIGERFSRLEQINVGKDVIVMKNKVSFVIIIAILLAISSACSQRDASTYEPLLIGMSDSNNSDEISTEYNLIDAEKYANYAPPMEVEFVFLGESYTATFSKVESYNGSWYFPISRYTSNNCEFRLTPEGKVIGFSNYQLQATGEFLSEEECVKIAQTAMGSMVHIQDYRIDSTTEQGDYYLVTFAKYLNGIQTVDLARVMIQKDGQISGITSIMLGEVPSNTKTDDIDFEVAKNAIYAKLDSMDLMIDGFDRLEYSEPKMYLTILKDGRRGLECTVEVNQIKEFPDGTEQTMGEKYRFIIPIPD